MAALQLLGCASVRLIDSDVTAFSSLPAVSTGTTYRFERLPSQQADAQRQDKLEALAQAAMGKVGLQRVGDAPGSPAARFAVQMGISVLSGSRPYWDDFGVGLGTPLGSHSGGYVTVGVGVGSPGFYGVGHFPGSFGYLGGPLLYLPPPYFVREVSLVLREASNGAVVFESRAKHEGPWSDSLAILPAMFDAALQGFPAPPAGLRRVLIEIPR